jgi:hypothetical protein
MKIKAQLLIAILTLAIFSTTSHAATTINVLIPAYANPCCDGGPNMWNSLVSAAEDPNRNYELHAIFNPASGPGSARDPNYLNSANNANNGPLADFRAAGGMAHGYVATNFGDRSLDAVKADVDAYLSGYYSGFIDGIFFDEMSNDLADVGYYQELHAYVQSKQTGATTFGNPGTTYTNNQSGQTQYSQADYINSLDTIMTFEGTRDDYANSYASFPYLDDIDSSKIAHAVHSQEDWDGSFLDIVSMRGAGYLYVTDDIMNTPYDAIPSYWEDFTADLSAHNASVVPVPAAAWLFGSGLLSLIGFSKRNRERLF